MSKLVSSLTWALLYANGRMRLNTDAQNTQLGCSLIQKYLGDTEKRIVLFTKILDVVKKRTKNLMRVDKNRLVSTTDMAVLRRTIWNWKHKYNWLKLTLSTAESTDKMAHQYSRLSELIFDEEHRCLKTSNLGHTLKIAHFRLRNHYDIRKEFYHCDKIEKKRPNNIYCRCSFCQIAKLWSGSKNKSRRDGESTQQCHHDTRPQRTADYGESH